MPPRIEDLTGKRFGRLTVMYQNGFKYKPSGQRNVLWHCKCDCGNEKDIPANTLRNGSSKSCGCLNRELAIERATIHGGCKNGTVENIYKIWSNMEARCYQTSSVRYKEYGGRGIKICDSWLDYSNFREWALKNGYKPGLSIDRIDVNGNYCPENCRWATAIEQANNTRRNLYITAFGTTKTLAEWAREMGVDSRTIQQRLKSGWDAEKAISDTTDERTRKLHGFGKTQSIKQWSKEKGIKYKTLHNRLRKNGYDIEKAVIGF